MSAQQEKSATTPSGNEVTPQTHQRAGTPLLASKFHSPRLPSSHVERSRLSAMLDAIPMHKMTLLAAPAGFGKTTVINQWINRERTSDAIPVAWLSLDEGDNDPVRFWRCVIAACQSLQVELGQSALAQLSSGIQPPFELPHMETVLTFLLNDLAGMEQNGLLILEDYHAISETAIHESLTFFIDHLPNTLHVIVLTRSEPPLPLVRWRARGEILEIQTTDLRFSQEETARFIQQAMPLTPPLSQEAIKQLDIRLEGWAAGLRLLVLALRTHKKQSEIEQQILLLGDGSRAMTHPQRPIQDFFISEVLNAQPKQLQDFLLRTSALSRLTGSLCDAVTEQQNSANLLATIERAGLFLEALDSSGLWYRYHSLFAEAMRAEANRRLGPNVLQHVCQQASQWYQQHDMPAEAIEAALLARDVEMAVVLIEQIIENRNFYEMHTLRRWTEQLPTDVLRSHPLLCFRYAMALLFTDSTFYNRFEEALQMAEDGWRSENNTVRLGEIFAFRAMIDIRYGQRTRAIEEASQALEWLPPADMPPLIVNVPTPYEGSQQEPLEWRSVCLGVLGMDAVDKGEFDTARQLLLEAHRRSSVAGNRGFKRITLLLLAATHLLQGELHQAAEYYRQVLTSARGDDDKMDIAHSLLGLAMISYEWHDLDHTEQILQEAAEVTQHPAVDALEIQELQGMGALVLAYVLAARGQSTRTLQLLATTLARLQASTFPPLFPMIPDLLLWQARIHIQRGDLSEAQRSLSALDHYENTLTANQRMVAGIRQAQILLAHNSPHNALDLLNQLLLKAQQRYQKRHIITIQILMALTYTALKQGQDARQSLLDALSLGYTDNFISPFLIEGEPLALLLRPLLPTLHDPSLHTFAQSILLTFSHTIASQDTPSALPATSPFQTIGNTLPIEALSAQEVRVLRLLAAGRTNPEIARELVVSVNTVKDHVKHVYRKLNVNNRIEAAETARRLKILA